MWLPQDRDRLCERFSVQKFLKEENRLLTHSFLVNVPCCPELTFVVVVLSNLFQLLGPQTHAQNLKYVPTTSFHPKVRGGSSANHSHF